MQEMQEKQVRSLGCEDSLEKEMTIHSSILAWKIPWTEEPGGLQPIGPERVGQLSTYIHTYTRKGLVDFTEISARK